MQTKRNSRKFAVQAVFQFFFSNENIDKILEEFLSFRSQETENQVIKYGIHDYITYVYNIIFSFF